MPRLVDAIQASLRVSDQPESRDVALQTLYTLHLVIKAQCSKALARRELQQWSPPVLQFLWTQVFGPAAVALSGMLDAGTEPDERLLRLSIGSLKSLRRLVVYGVSNHKEPGNHAAALMESLPTLLGRLLTVLTTPLQPGGKMPMDLLAKLATLIGKVFLDLQEADIIAFIGAPGSLRILELYSHLLQMYPSEQQQQPEDNNRAETRRKMDRILIQAITALRRVVKNSEFHVVKDDAARKAEKEAAIALLNTSILSPESVAACAQMLILKYTRLSAEDMDKWSNDPEAFVQEEIADHWEFSVRVCFSFWISAIN